MTRIDPKLVVRAWRDPKFAASLPEELRRRLPANPAGVSASAEHADAQHGARGVGPQGTITADCSTITASCSTITADCSTIKASCSTITAGCSTISAGCSTIKASCSTITSNCDTRLSCTRASGC